MDAEEIAALAGKVGRASWIDKPTRVRIIAALREFEADKREFVTIPRMK